jgi:hypothetical protein
MDSINSLYADKKEIPPAIVWDAVNGFRPLNKTGKKALDSLVAKAETAIELTQNLPEALRLASRVQEVTECGDTFFFMANIHLHWTDATVIQGIWNLRDVFKSNGSMLILMTNAGAQMPNEIASDVLVLDEPLPTEDELKTIIKNTYEFAQLKEPDEAVLKSAVDALIGLPAFPAEQATAMCLDVKSKTLDIKELWSRKRQAINQSPGLSVWEGAGTLDDMGGLSSIKECLRRICKGNDAPTTILFMDEIEKAYAGTGTDTSGTKTELTGRMLSWTQDKEIDGMIWIGVPGGGKSQLVKNTGSEFNIPVINFDLAGMQGSLVGQSGANLRQAQATIDAISGGKILMIATCNSIGSLPPELRRRFNLGIFFFDVPTSKERAGIWTIYRKKYGIKASDTIPHDIGWTGAEIKECCKKAYKWKISLKEASNYIVPVTKSSAEIIEGLRRSAIDKYLSANYPGPYKYVNMHEESEMVVTTGRKLKN